MHSAITNIFNTDVNLCIDASSATMKRERMSENIHFISKGHSQQCSMPFCAAVVSQKYNSWECTVPGFRNGDIIKLRITVHG